MITAFIIFYVKGERMMTKRGFTLIELLIVVAIIAILAAIAVPNFLEAQTRAKVSRVKSDMRSVATAMECYRVDNNRYIPSCGYPGLVYPENDPPNQMVMSYEWISDTGQAGTNCYVVRLTSPISYIASIPVDPFTAAYHKIHTGDGTPVAGSYNNMCFDWLTESKRVKLNLPDATGWSPFNDMGWHFTDMGYLFQSAGPNFIIWGADTSSVYDPTNGTVSAGDIWYGPKTNFVGGK